MKSFLSVFLFALPFTLFSKTVDVLLVNRTEYDLQVFYQVLGDRTENDPEFIVQLRPGGKKTISVKVKRDQRLKITGYGAGTETLPVVKSFDHLNADHVKIELVLPKMEKIETVELSDMLLKVKNDNWLTSLLDSSRYTTDQLPVLGSFVFYNHHDKTTLALLPTYWKNSKEKRSVNNQYFERVDYVTNSNAAGLRVSGVPFLKSLGSAFSNATLLEIRWKVNNAHIEQWQPVDKNPSDILLDPSCAHFLEACVNEMTTKNLSAGDYSLYFMSSAMITDNICVSAKKYSKVTIKADADFAACGPDLEVVKPLGMEADYGYTREKGFSTVDSTCNIYLKFLAQDYTAMLNSHINKSARNAQKQSAVKNLEALKITIVNEYQALSSIDTLLLKTNQVEVILPIVGITQEMTVETTSHDARKSEQFNAILKETKSSIAQYKSTVESIQKLDQSKDYFKLMNSISTVEIDNSVIDAYVKSKG